MRVYLETLDGTVRALEDRGQGAFYRTTTDLSRATEFSDAVAKLHVATIEHYGGQFDAWTEE